MRYYAPRRQCWQYLDIAESSGIIRQVPHHALRDSDRLRAFQGSRDHARYVASPYCASCPSAVLYSSLTRLQGTWPFMAYL